MAMVNTTTCAATCVQASDTMVVVPEIAAVPTNAPSSVPVPPTRIKEMPG